MNAFSRPPSAATRRENSPGFNVVVPLNNMCSNTCATPEVPSTSSMEPTRNHTMCTAVGARRSGLTMSVNPLESVNCCTASGVWACAAGVSHRPKITGKKDNRGWRAGFIEWCDSKNTPNVQFFQKKTPPPDALHRAD